MIDVFKGKRFTLYFAEAVVIYLNDVKMHKSIGMCDTALDHPILSPASSPLAGPCSLRRLVTDTGESGTG